MRNAIASLLIALFVSMPVHAIGDLTALMGVQEECAQVGDISFGADKRWTHCQVDRGRWVATIDLIDMYQAQYCLGAAEGSCDQKALLLFGNRAYTPTANLLIQRIDPGATKYDDPLVVKNEYGRILTVTARQPDGVQSSQYYLWRSGRWQPIDTHAWLKDLAKRLPAGVSAESVSLPDVDSMTAQVKLFHKKEKDCCSSAGVANVELGVTKMRFSMKKMIITSAEN